MGSGTSGQALLDGPVQLDVKEFGVAIEKALREALDSYKATVPSHRVWRAPGGDAATFIKKNLCVRVERFESGDFKVIPLHHYRGGYIGKEGEHILVSAEDVPTKIASVLTGAFSVAT